MKIVIVLLLLIPGIVKADSYMNEYKNKILRRDELYKGKTNDLKDEMKGEIESNPLEDLPAPVQAQELPPPANQEALNQAKGQQSPVNMNIQDAAAMGRKLRDQQKAQKVTK